MKILFHLMLSKLCYSEPLHTHVEDHFHRPQILTLVFGTHTEGI